MSRTTEYCERDFDDEYESESDTKIELMRLRSVIVRKIAFNQIGRNKVDKWARRERTNISCSDLGYVEWES